MLPWNIQPYESLRARFPEAIKREWKVAEVLEDGDRPGIHPEHIFDTEIGMRLIISIDRDGERRHLHISSSLSPDYYGVIVQKVNEKLKEDDEMNVQGAMGLLVAEEFSKVSGFKNGRVGAILKITPNGILHMIIPFDDEVNLER